MPMANLLVKEGDPRQEGSPGAKEQPASHRAQIDRNPISEETRGSQSNMGMIVYHTGMYDSMAETLTGPGP